MSYRCRAAVLMAPGEPLTIEEIELAEPAAGEVLVRTVSAGICATDLHFAVGRFPYPVPTVLGHEASGVIEAVGPGVTSFSAGDRVIVCDQIFCGRCAACLSGAMVYCTDTSGKERQRHRLTLAGQPIRQYLGVSAFAELMLTDANALIPLPPDISHDAGALLGCCLTTGLASVFNVAQPKPGDSIAVFGCGGVGLGAVQGARIAGATQIIAVDLEDHRLAAAAKVGATVTINAGFKDPVEEIRAVAPGGVNRSIEAVGLIETAGQAFAVLAPGGQATVLGMLPAGAAVPVPGSLLRHGRSLGGSVMGSVRSRADIPRYADLARTGMLAADDIATHRRPLQEINEALRAATAREGIRQMIRFTL
ncbi:zinc-binding dehydrogenase [Kitasatospora acidiphila]|uniref:Zinc-binding dehydrogenase n=1 Tax=Kitasatospora acidiphila TaxID=2567942 RepID=A0A540W489_9ACTN|nr:zinc-binding dehydrogenase [Kitasatospora acidiphila]TQF03174.1 zinc-binding dehydrogenase [Kitasatospora acidiphila]